jgi:hypothetical protein
MILRPVLDEAGDVVRISGEIKSGESYNMNTYASSLFFDLGLRKRIFSLTLLIYKFLNQHCWKGGGMEKQDFVFNLVGG